MTANALAARGGGKLRIGVGDGERRPSEDAPARGARREGECAASVEPPRQNEKRTFSVVRRSSR
jgi:hypothetical protein